MLRWVDDGGNRIGKIDKYVGSDPASRHYMDTVCDETLRFFLDVGRAQGGLLFFMDSELNSVSHVASGLGEDFLVQYPEYYRFIDPTRAPFYAKTDKNIVTDLDVPLERNKMLQELVHDLVRPCGFGPVMKIFLREESRIVAGICLLKGKEQGSFTKADSDLITKARRYAEFNVTSSFKRYLSSEVDPIDQLKAHLTRKEKEVFDLLCRGASNNEIAKRLTIAESTVKTHLRHIYAKFGLDNRRDLFAFILKCGRGDSLEP